MDIYVARQPIFRRNKTRLGYELLFRDGLNNAFPDIDGSEATSRVLSGGFISMGIQNVVGNGTAFVNFTRELLVNRAPMMFPKEQLVVEILEDVIPDQELVQACVELAENGYTIALDDFLYRPEMARLIGVAGIIKFDLSITPLETLEPVLQKLSSYRVELLAEKVETHEDFHKALELGFKYFQGFFFSRPEILKGRDISSPQMYLLEIMAEANRNDMDFQKLERMIERDVGVSYKLLRHINSAYFRPISEITSIRQAVVMIGERGIRRFLSLIAMAGLASGKPDELIRESIVRARFCENLAGPGVSSDDRSKFFTLGLFSLIDAIMDESMESLMTKLPLSGEIKQALVLGKGLLGEYLRILNSYQKGAWAEVAESAERLALPENHLLKSFLDSVAWAESLVDL